MNEREYQELKRIRQENEWQTSIMLSKYRIGTSVALICLGIVLGGAIGAILIVLGALLMLSPIFLAIFHISENTKDEPLKIVPPKKTTEETDEE